MSSVKNVIDYVVTNLGTSTAGQYSCCFLRGSGEGILG